MQFTKLFNSILDSTIWQEPPATKLVWITMLAMADRMGDVHTSIPGLAKRAGVSLPECEDALRCLLAPDPYSRTKDHDGRRIEEIDGGFSLLNHGKYRALLSAEERREYNRRKQAEYRAKKKGCQNPVNDTSLTVNHSEQNAHSTEAEAEEEAEKESVHTPTLPPCSIEQAIEAGRPLGMTPQDVQAWFDHRDTNEWTVARTGGRIDPIRDWRKDLRNSKSWAQEKASKAKTKGASSVKNFGI